MNLIIIYKLSVALDWIQKYTFLIDLLNLVAHIIQTKYITESTEHTDQL